MNRNSRYGTEPTDTARTTDRVRTHRGAAALADPVLRAQWEALADTIATRIASRPHYVLGAHSTRAMGRLLTVTVHRGADLVAIAPLWVLSYGPLRVARVVGDGFGLPVEILAVDEAAARALWSGVRSHRIAMYFEEADADSAPIRALTTEPGWESSALPSESGDMIRLPEDGSGSRGLRSGHARRRLAAAKRTLEKRGHRVEFEFVTSTASFDSRWEEMTALSALATSSTGHIDYLAGTLGSFVRGVLRSEYVAGRAGIVGLRVDGRWVAQLITSTTAHRAECWLTHYDPALGQARPGHLLMQNFTDLAGDLNLTDIDLGAGSNEFKAAWSTGTYTPVRAVAVPTSVSAPARAARLISRLEAAGPARKVRLLRGLLARG